MPEPARSGPPAALSAGVDVGAAVTASLAVSPFIMTIDAAIVGAAAGRHTLGGAIARGTAETLRRPWGLMRNPGYWMVASVYAATYATANLIDSVSARREVSPAVHGTTKLLAKDVAFARMYGAAKGGRMPPVTVALFGARDLLTVASAYTIPPILAAALERGGGGNFTQQQAEASAQLIAPVAMQVVCAPVHLLALNCYNVPVSSVAQRAAAVAHTAPQTIVAYAVRMAPSFGIGVVMNSSLTCSGHAALQRHYAAEGAQPAPR
eukprot:COSAG06_NODE_5822_length_3257_cov_1.176377_4_plen_265_part_00